jgi:hypothetical protein
LAGEGVHRQEGHLSAATALPDRLKAELQTGEPARSADIRDMAMHRFIPKGTLQQSDMFLVLVNYKS